MNFKNIKRAIVPVFCVAIAHELTALGCALRQVVEPLGAWARAHMNDMKRARETYDKRDET
jgi:DNA-binding HxlR family transcriptional regulator